MNFFPKVYLVLREGKVADKKQKAFSLEEKPWLFNIISIKKEHRLNLCPLLLFVFGFTPLANDTSLYKGGLFGRRDREEKSVNFFPKVYLVLREGKVADKKQKAFSLEEKPWLFNIISIKKEHRLNLCPLLLFVFGFTPMSTSLSRFYCFKYLTCNHHTANPIWMNSIP